MTLLVITRGLPASGKTTWAREWVTGYPQGKAARVNRDDVRHNLFGVYWGLTYEQEERVTVVQHAAVRSLLRIGVSVVVDDTNLRLAHAKALAKIAVENGAEWEVKDFPVDPSVCVDRDIARKEAGERAVGDKVIWGMADRYGLHKRWLDPVVLDTPEGYGYTYEPNLTRPDAWLVDIDGTLAHMGERGPFDWHRVGEDKVNEPVADVVRLLYPSSNVVLMSGRDEVCRDATVNWLDKHGIVVDALHMRPFKDMRKDAVVKLELFREHVAPWWNVIAVIDDRDQVVDMWRSIGLTCFQVAPGAF